jgi:hypothetical protein
MTSARSIDSASGPPPQQGGSGGGGNLYLLQIVWHHIKKCWKGRKDRANKQRRKEKIVAHMRGDNQRPGGKKQKVIRNQRGRLKMSSYSDGAQGRRGYLRGGKERDHRLFAIKVTISAVGESITEVVGTACTLKSYVSELHVVTPYSLPGTSEDREENPLKGLYKGWKEDQRDLEAVGIKVIVHPRRYHENWVGSHVRRLIDAPSLVEMSADVFEELLEDYMTPHFHKHQFRRRRYSVRTKVQENGWSLWTPMIVTMLMYDWWRSLFTQLWRTAAPKDVVIYPVNHADYGAFVPDEYRWMGLFRGVGVIMDRDRPLCPEDGASIHIPAVWTGWERVVWMAQHTDLIGMSGLLLGWPLLSWFLSVPFWNLLVPWLEVELFGMVRLGIWAIHTALTVLVLNKIYEGPMQNLVAVVAVPLCIIPMMPILLYAKYFVRHQGITRRRVSGSRDGDMSD